MTKSIALSKSKRVSIMGGYSLLVKDEDLSKHYYFFNWCREIVGVYVREISKPLIQGCSCTA